MVKITITYFGEKHCKVLHEPSQSVLETDAPKDNQGRGEKFSPTDLVATALASCVLTTVGISAEKDGIDMRGSQVFIEKEMSSNPRRIAHLNLVLEIPESVPKTYLEKIEETAKKCPVAQSLHPDVKITFLLRTTQTA